MRKQRPTAIVEGEVLTLTGVVRALGEPLAGPLSHKRCVAFEARVRIALKPAGTSLRIGNLLTKLDVRRMVPFELVTDLGAVRIEGPEVELDLPVEPLIPRCIDCERAFLAEHADASIDLRTADFEERRLAPGDRVSITGLVARTLVPGDAADLRDSTWPFRLVPHDDNLLVVKQ